MATMTKRQPSDLHRPSPAYFGEAGPVLTNVKYKRWFTKRLGELAAVLDNERMTFLEKAGWDIPASLIEALEGVLLHVGQPSQCFTAEFDGVLTAATAVCRALDRACPNKPWEEATIDEIPGSFWSGVLLKLHEEVLRLLDPPEDAPSGPKMLETLQTLLDQKVPERQICGMYGWFKDNGQPDLERVATEKADPTALTRPRYAPEPEKKRANPMRTCHAGLLEFMAYNIESYHQD